MSNPYDSMGASTYSNVADDAGMAAPDAAPSDSDGGVLELGSSVSVNDDLHRTLKEEVAELDKLCREAKSGLDVEARTEREIAFAQGRADAEMKSLLDGSTRTLEGVDVDEETLRKIKGTVLQEFHDGKTGQAAGEHKTPKDYLAHVNAENWKVVKAKREDVARRRNEQEDLKEKVLQLVGIMQELRELEALDDGRAAEDEKQIAELQAQQEQAERVLTKETERLGSLEAAAKGAEAELVKAREAKAEKVAAFEAHKTASQQKRADKDRRVEEARQRNSALKKEKADVAQEGEEWDRKGEAASQHLREVQALLEERKAHQDAAEATRAERLQVHADKAALEADLSALHSELDQQSRMIAKEQEKAETIQKEALATEELHAEKCSTALKDELAEMIQHVRDTELLAKDLQENGNPPIKVLEEELATTRELIAQCKAGTDAALDELQGRKARVQDKASALEAQRASLAVLAEVTSHNTQLEDDIAALQRSVNDQARLETEREEKAFRLRVYREAAKLLKETAGKEEHALALTAADAIAVYEAAGSTVPQAAEADDRPGGDTTDSEVPDPPVVRLHMW